MIKRIVFAFLLILLLPIALMGLVLGSLQSRWGQDLLVAQVNQRVPGIELRDLRGSLPFSPRLGHLAFSDEDGVWFALDDATISLAVAPLFGGRVHFEEISAARLAVHRTPSGDETPEPEDEEPTSFELPQSLPLVIVDELRIDEIALGEPLMGQAAAFKLAGAARTEDNRLDATLRRDRTDAPGAHIRLDANADLEGPALTLDLDVEERSGLMAGLAKDPRLDDVTLALAGDGPLEAWRGQLALAIPALASTTADIGLQVTDEQSITVDGYLRPADGLLDGDLQSLIADGLSYGATLARQDSALIVEHVELDTGWARLAGNASVDGQAISADINAAIPALAPIGKALAQDLAGDIELAAKVEGTLDQPTAGIDLQGRELGFAGHTIERLGHQSTLERFADGAMAVNLTGDLEKVTLADGKTLPPQPVTWSGDVAISPAGPITIDDLRLTALGAQLTAKGRVEPAPGTGQINIAVDAGDLASFGPLAGRDLAGTAGADATIELAQGFKQIDASSSVVLSGLAGLEGLSALSLDSSVTGSLEDQLEGTVDATATYRNEAFTLAAPFRYGGDVLALPDLRLDGADLSMNAALETALATTTTVGTVTARSEDLARLTGLFDQAIAGALSLDVDLSAPEGQQNASVDASLRRVTGGFGALDQADVQVQVRDALGQLGLDGTLDAQQFSTGDMVVDRLEVGLEGSLQQLNVDLVSTGNLPQTFRVETALAVSKVDAGRELRLENLRGFVDTVSWQTLKPATVALTGQTVSLDELALELDGGTLTAGGSVDQGNGAVDLSLSIDGLPVDVARPFAPLPYEGQINGGLRLDGSLTEPRMQSELSIAGFRPLDPALADLPALDVEVDSGLAGGQLEANLIVAGLTNQPLQASATLPARLQLQPFLFELDQQGSLSGSLEGEADLAPFTDYLALDGQEIAGLLRADLRFGGRIDRPNVTGTLSLTDGLVSDEASGARIQNLALTLEGRGREIRLTDLQADDGGQGKMTGSGRFALPPASGQLFDFTITSDRMRLVHSDVADAIISGDLGASGDMADLSVIGRLTVNEAEIRIPNPSPGGVKTLPVAEIGIEPGAGPAPPAVEEPAEPVNIALDITVDVPSQTFVRGRGLESEWAGAIEVEGDASSPEITGAIEVKRGYLDLLDRRFELAKGVVSFDGAFPPQPTVDVDARADAGDFTAIVLLQGPVTEPELTFTSEPEAPEDEVISNLLFDRSVDEITPAQGVKLALALKRLQDSGPSPLDKIRNVIGLDTIDVDSADGGSVKAGKYLSDRVFVEVEQGVGEQSGGARVEVEITPRIKLQSDVSETGDSGVGLNWSYDY
ncbi:MAG: translocation/assembly module TamB domain-containing protein [Geminicoccaceae bacterium]